MAFLLLAGVFLLRLCREPEIVEPPRSTIQIPPPPARTATAPAPAPRRAQPPPPQAPSPDRLRPFLEKLGRARVLKDRRTLDTLRGQSPPVLESDVDALLGLLEGDLFPAAGVAELVRLFGWRSAVPPLSAVLATSGRYFLKEVVIETLAALGGDAAEVPLLAALRTDPDEGVRLRCAAALDRFRSPEALRTLIDALRDPSARVRSAAGAALARQNAAGAVDALFRALGEERDPSAQADLVVSTYAAGGAATREDLLRLLEARPDAAQLLRSRVRTHDDARYRRPYDRGFFEPGAPAIPFDATKPRIGITLEPGADVPPREIALILFGAAPLDRYRGWFYFRKADDFPALTAYDGNGNPMEPVPYGDLEGTVFLHFKDPSSFDQGVLGYTTGCHAFVQGASLLHEFGHAFARLGDEYEGGSRDDAANLFRSQAVPWLPLVSASILPAPPKRDADFFIPSDSCHLNNNPAATRFCAVCQLEIHARMAELTGAPLPW